MSNFNLVSSTLTVAFDKGLVSEMDLRIYILLFAMNPSSEKFGIDFLGGGEVRIRTASAMTTTDVETEVRKISENSIGDSASIRSIADSEIESGKYTDFQIAVKRTEEERGIHSDEEGGVSALRAIIARELSSILLPDGVQAVGERMTIEGEAGR